MTGYLLDTNVLIALIDSVHTRHDEAHAWFTSGIVTRWATCPLTENGVLRIVGNPRYPNSPGTPSAVVDALQSLLLSPGHEFWPDNISLVASEHVERSHLSSASQITDTYLLALARAHDGQLATFDRQLVTNAVLGGKQALCLIG